MPTMPSRLPLMRRPSIQVGDQPVHSPSGIALRAFDEPARHREDQRHGHVGGVLGQHARRVGDGDAALQGGGDVDIVDAVAEIGDQLQLLAGLARSAAASMRSVTVGTSTSAVLQRLDEFGLAHRLVVDVEPGVEQFAHARFDAVRQFARDDHERFLPGHPLSCPPATPQIAGEGLKRALIHPALTVTGQEFKGSRGAPCLPATVFVADGRSKTRTLGKARPALRAARQGDQPDMRQDIAPALESRPMAAVRARRGAALRGCARLVAAVVLAVASLTPARADPVGPVSGLPLPRYVSLKSDRVNLREGPSKDHRTTWVFLRAGLPVEITAEFDIWRKVRDFRRRRGLGSAFASVRAAHRPRHAMEEGRRRDPA